MSNQENSPPPVESSGSTTRIVEQFFERYCQANGLTPEHESTPYSRYVFYCGVAQMYNVWVESMHRDKTLKSTAVLSEAVRQDINVYFEGLQAQQKNQVN